MLKSMAEMMKTDVGKEYFKSLFEKAGTAPLGCDRVFSIPCEGWPEPAQQWAARERYWPEKSVVEKVVSSGFHVVPKSSPQGNMETEWRLSFSDAELCLVYQYNPTQRRCFLAAKAILNEELKPKFEHGYCTYFVKTTMLWTCEHTPTELWQENNLTKCIALVLTNLANFYWDGNTSYLPHFFVPSFDLIGHFNDDLKKSINEHLVHIAGSLGDIAELHIREERGLWNCKHVTVSGEGAPEEILAMVPEHMKNI